MMQGFAKKLPYRAKIEAMAMATGRALYGADWAIAKMGQEPLVALILHSQIPSTRILAIDSSLSLQIPGVKALLTYQNCPNIFSPIINNVCDPIAIVAATSLTAAKAALKAVQIKYEEPSTTEATAFTGGGSIATHSGYSIHDWQVAPLEPPCCLGFLDELGRLQLVSANKYPFEVRRTVAKKMGLPLQQVRVRSCRCGGNFGAKEQPTLATMVAALVLATKQPVQLELCHEELFYLEAPAGQLRQQLAAAFAAGQELDIAARQNGDDLLAAYLDQMAPEWPAEIRSALKEDYTHGLATIGWAEKRRQQLHHQGLCHGVGLAIVCQKMANLATAWNKVTTQINEDGSCQLLSGLADDGSGSDTILAQLAAHNYGCPPDQVIVHSGDTDLTSDPHLFDSVNEREPEPEIPVCAVHFAEVAIDPESGAVRVINYALIASCLSLGNQELSQNQLAGGVTWGLSNCLAMETLWDKSGKIINPSLTEQHLFSTRDIPHLTTEISFLTPHSTAATVGDLTELGISGVAPAVANAIYDAVGIRLAATPFTAEHIFMTLKKIRKNNERND